MRVLVFDTETTGLPKSRLLSPDTLHLWPHIVQFSYIVYDIDDNQILDITDEIVKIKKCMIIPDEATQIHGITTQMSHSNGIEIESVLTDFFSRIKNVDTIVGHNVSFDIDMVRVELMRIICDNTRLREDVIVYKNHLHSLTTFENVYCTLKNTIELCDIQAVSKYGKTYQKYPKLIELHQKLFSNVTPNHLHNSLNDIIVTLRCYIKLKINKDLNVSCDEFANLMKKNDILC